MPPRLRHLGTRERIVILILKIQSILSKFGLVSLTAAQNLQISNKNALFAFVSFLHSLGPKNVHGVGYPADDGWQLHRAGCG